MGKTFAEKLQSPVDFHQLLFTIYILGVFGAVAFRSGDRDRFGHLGAFYVP